MTKQPRDQLRCLEELKVQLTRQSLETMVVAVEEVGEGRRVMLPRLLSALTGFKSDLPWGWLGAIQAAKKHRTAQNNTYRGMVHVVG